MLKNKLIAIVIKTSWFASFCLLQCSWQSPLPLCQLVNGNGKWDFSMAWTICSHNVEFWVMVFTQILSLMKITRTWRKSIVQNAKKYVCRENCVYNSNGGASKIYSLKKNTHLSRNLPTHAFTRLLNQIKEAFDYT